MRFRSKTIDLNSISSTESIFHGSHIKSAKLINSYIYLYKYHLINSHQPLKTSLKILRLIIIALLAWGIFFYMDRSQDFNQFLQSANRFRTDYGLLFYATAGLVKLALLITGVVIPLGLVLIFIRKKMKNDDS